MRLTASLKLACVLALIGVAVVCISYWRIQQAQLLHIRTAGGSDVCHARILSTPSERGELKQTAPDVPAERCYLVLYADPKVEPVLWMVPMESRLVYLNSAASVIPHGDQYRSVLVLPEDATRPAIGTAVYFLGPVPRAIEPAGEDAHDSRR